MRRISFTQRITLQILVMFCSLLTFNQASAQNVYIPDANFRAYLQTEFPACMVGSGQDSLDTQCSSVLTATLVDVSHKNIYDLTGIQYFSGLHRLFCDHNQLTSLPNLPSTMNFLLDCSYNQLTALPPLLNTDWLSCHHNQLTSIPPFNIDIYLLDCRNNPISCLPMLPPLDAGYGTLILDSTNIDCLPNKVYPGFSGGISPPDLPICTPAISPCAYNNISGIAYHDANQNCQHDTLELLLKNRIIELQKNGATFYASTDSNGYYYTNVDTGIYTINQVNYQNNFSITCPAVPYTLTVTSISNSYSNIDFPNNADSCKFLTVDIATARQRIGGSNNGYSVNYCNNGVMAVSNAYIEITFDPEVIPLSSTLPWSNVSGNTYTFNIGTINAMDCGTFMITDSVSINAILNQAACATAIIYPIDTACFQAKGAWDKSRLAVTGACNGATLDFTIQNIGDGNMSGSSDYRIYEDDVLVMNPALPALNAGASFPVSIPSNGKTYRVEVDQIQEAPGYSKKPKAIIELCGNPNQSVQHVTSTSQDDGDPYIETVCIELVNSYDPNHKQASPKGFTANNYIYENDELEYTIDFQNTGNDTAYHVTLSDTIDVSRLDMTTIEPGVSSHPYQMKLWGTNELIFIFKNINLLPASVDSIKSQGFVKFKIKQKANNPVGTDIDNKVYIYFDYNTPIITNIANVEIYEDPIILSVNNKVYSQTSVNLYPNPFSNELNISITGDHQSTQFELYDILGNVILKQQGGLIQKISFDNTSLAAGSYFYKVYADDNLVGTGRLIAK